MTDLGLAFLTLSILAVIGSQALEDRRHPLGADALMWSAVPLAILAALALLGALLERIIR